MHKIRCPAFLQPCAGSMVAHFAERIGYPDGLADVGATNIFQKGWPLIDSSAEGQIESFTPLLPVPVHDFPDVCDWG